MTRARYAASRGECDPKRFTRRGDGQPRSRLSGRPQSESFMTTSSDLTDAVLITGAGRRVGLHLAERMLGRGRPVIAHYRTWTEGVARLQARGALCVAGDLAT